VQPSDLGLLVTAGSVAVSPDGRRVVVVVNRVDLTGNTYRSQLWLHDESGPPRPLTRGEHDAQPTWSPDGRLLAFTSRRGDKRSQSTIHVLPMSGPGETITIATMPEAASGLQWSPDGKYLAFASRTQDSRYGEDDEAKHPPRRIARFFSRLDNEGWVVDRPMHVYVVAADGTEPPRNLTPGEFEFANPSWLADSSGVIVEGRAHDTWDLDFAQDLYRVGLDGMRTELTHQTGVYRMPSVSPDGTVVAFVGHDDPTLYPQNAKIGVLELTSGSRRWLTLGLDRTFEPTGGSRAPRWDGDGLVVGAEDRGDVRVYRVELDGSTPVAMTPADATAKSFDLAGGTLACSISTIDRPAELFVGGTRATTLSDRFVAVAAPVGAERFTAPSTNGVEVDGWILTPPDLDPTRRYPVLLNVHGGPHSQYGNTFFDEAQVQAAAGFVVVMSNPRGSSGREEAWGQAILGPNHPVKAGGGWGSVDVDDVHAVLDEALRRHSFCDPDRVGMIGGSYGGWMATWLAATSKRFRAVCSERAVNNMLTEEYTSDIATEFRVEHGPTHLDSPDDYLRISPITFVRDIDTPMLLLHSENDLRCPISQAEELFVALRLLGKDVEFHRFPGEGHELSRSGSPVHRRQRMEIILEYFGRHLGSSTPPS
jgi:dipeptidyl aminopeptidase/acylaminoacyl peptidase